LAILREKYPIYVPFLEMWHLYIDFLVIGAALVGVMIYLAYKIQYGQQKTLKAKYEFASEFEVKRFFSAHVAFAAALFFFINTLRMDVVIMDPIWFFIRFFIAGCGAILHGYVAKLILNYYWPGQLNKKLERLRYTPRVNPKTGNRMKLLSEDEEDAYLDEGMQAEENVFSVDYDVWIDEQTGETYIEKYQGRLTALECDRCGFQTLKLQKEEILKPVSATEDGELQKEFKCSYCGRIKRKTVILSHEIRKDASQGQLISDPLKKRKHVVTVKVEIFSNQNDHLNYEFQNLEQAQKFLEEFDFEKVEN
jgi:DNA-directed RNA polymerase subunit RPC12/RpoP